LRATIPPGGVAFGFGAMTYHVIHVPCDAASVRALHVGDTMTLEDWLFGIRDATQIAMFDQGRNVLLDLRGHAVVHTAPNGRRVAPRTTRPSARRDSAFLR
jgi:L(+)-tartrate dehydratase beta subunit